MQRARICLVVAAGILFIALEPALPPVIGQIDFRAYWSASYLLSHHQNFGAPDLLLQVEREQTGWQDNYPMAAWNPPWVFVLLLPYTLIPFGNAVWWWLLTNIFLVFLSSIIVWHQTATKKSTLDRVWYAMLVAFAYSPTLTALIAGQINILVLVGLITSVYLIGRREALAGMALGLTLVKPHLIYLTVPVILLEWFRKRRWRALGGFAGVVIVSSLIVFILRPTVLFDYGQTVSGGNLFQWQTPTLGGLADNLLGWHWVKLIGIVVLPLVLLVWWRSKNDWDWRVFIDVTVLLSVITAPFGWSYDFVVLLVPLLRMTVWLVEGALPSRTTVVIGVLLILADLLMYYERVWSHNELYFVWVPFAIAGMYLYVAWRMKRERGSVKLSMHSSRIIHEV